MNKTPTAEQIKQEADEWLVQLRSGHATAKDAQEFRSWCAQSREHVRAFAEANRLWERLGDAAAAVGEVAGPRSSYGSWSGHVLSRRGALYGLLAGAAAGAVTAAVVVYPPFGLWPSPAELRAQYRTRAGERRAIAGGPGFNIELNTRTSLNLRMSREGEPEVELISGEAVFQTTSSLSKDVTVLAGGVEARSKDGEFSVRCDSIVAVACMMGSVSVAYDNARYTVAPKSRLVFGPNGKANPEPVNTELLTAWRRGRVTFHETAVAEVIAEINRYRSGRIILLNEELAARTVDLDMPISQIDDVFSFLTRIYGAKITPLAGGVVLVS